ncbi:MAG: cytochrome oxidase putative small subunit CydP [Burkholderiaceae bacterium]|jgi:multidrug resistance efflux pump|nr:hypothetical protein [Burkholderiaceae bacterium]
MTPDERRLVRHLVTAVLVKLAVLVGLWWGFVRDQRVETDTARTAAHLGATTPDPGATP